MVESSTGLKPANQTTFRPRIVFNNPNPKGISYEVSYSHVCLSIVERLTRLRLASYEMFPENFFRIPISKLRFYYL
jgi:hypothetical protein